MKKITGIKIIAAFAVTSALFTGCSGMGGSSSEAPTDTSQSQTSDSQGSDMTSAPDSTDGISDTEEQTSRTGDVDGDGFLEEMGTDINDMVDDVVTGVEDIAGDIIDGGNGSNGASDGSYGGNAADGNENSGGTMGMR